MEQTELTFIFTGDIHMSNRLPYARPTTNGLTDRLEDQLKLWDRIRFEVIERGADGLVVMGDLFDKAWLDPVTLTETVKVIQMIAELCPVYVLPGNHDASTTKGGRFNVEALASLDNVTCLGAESFTPNGVSWLKFWPVPYAGIESNKETLTEYRAQLEEEGESTQQVCLFHNNVYGCKHLAWVCDDGIDADELCEGWDVVLSGHFHTHQSFGDCGMYLGAPMQHHFGDRGEKRGIWSFTFRKKKPVVKEFIPTELPRFWKLLRLKTPAHAAEGDYVRFEIEATHADWELQRHTAASLCGALNDFGIHATYKHKPVYHHEERMVSGDDLETISMEEMTGRYVDSKEVVTGEMDKELLKMLGREFMEEARREAK